MMFFCVYVIVSQRIMWLDIYERVITLCTIVEQKEENAVGEH